MRHIPEFRVADPYVTREVTVRDLLVHRTGIEQMDILWVRGFDTRTSLEQMQYAKQASSLRSTWAYNNSMYVVAAEVVARVSGMTFQDFVSWAHLHAARHERQPVHRSGAEQARQRHRLSSDRAGRRARDEPYLSPDPLGAAGVQSSVADMAKWLRMLLNEGTFEGKAGREVAKPSRKC